MAILVLNGEKMKYIALLLLVLALVSGCTSIPKIHEKVPTVADMESLGKIAARGRMDAIDELALTADKLYEASDHNEKKPVAANLVLMRAAFTPIGKKAGKGSRPALEALKYANANQRLRSFTSDAFGIAAGMGNKEALDILLNYKEHGFLLSSTVFALRYAAEANIPEAVDFLIEVTNTPKDKPLWQGASQGLAGAAARGNTKAEEALRRIAKKEDRPKAVSEDSDKARHSDEAEKTARQLSERIQTELNLLTNHPWAGAYYCGDGLGVNVSLLIAPEAGYVFEWHGCLGLYDRNYGSVTATNGAVRLSFAFKNEQKGFRGIAENLIPVPWSSRHYLIPSDDVIGFCNRVNGGIEPREDAHGFYLLRRGDEKKMVSGFPAVPDEYSAYLLTTPISAEIAGIRSVTTRPSVCKWRFKDTTVVLNAGKNKGLLKGMELQVTKPSNLVESVVITKVEETTAEAVMTQAGEKEQGPEEGWNLSTRCPWK